MRGFPIASNMEKLVELHREGALELPAETVAAQETVERTDAIGVAVAERSQTARDRASVIGSEIPAKIVEAARTGSDPEDTIAELEESEAEARRADRLLLFVNDAAERARERLEAHAYDEATWAAMDTALQSEVLDKAAKALERLPAGVDSMADLRTVPRQQVGKIRDALAEIEDAHALYAALRRRAESLAVLCFATDGQTGRLPGDALDRLVFSFRTGYRLIDHNRPRWPESGTPFLRYVIEHRDELGPWIPDEDAWRQACTAALEAVSPEDVRLQREAWAAPWR